MRNRITLEELFWALAALLVLQGLVYFFFTNLRAWLLRDALLGGHRTPAQLFWNAVLWSVSLWIVIAVGVFPGTFFLFPLYVLGIPFALRGWYNVFRQGALNARRLERMEERYRFPRFQFRILDLWGGALVIGLVMKGVLSIDFGARHPEVKFIVAGMTIAVEMVAFLIAMDVCRRSAALERALPRFLTMLAVMLLAMLMPLFPALVMAWCAWQHAMWRARMPV